MLVMEGQQLPEDRGEKGKKTAMTEDFPPVLRDENQIRPVDRETLGQSYLAGRLSLHIFLLLILALVILVLDKTIP